MKPFVLNGFAFKINKKPVKPFVLNGFVFKINQILKIPFVLNGLLTFNMSVGHETIKNKWYCQTFWWKTGLAFWNASVY